MRKIKNPEDIWLIDGDKFIQGLLYSINNVDFYYNALTFGGDCLVVKYDRETHEDIQNQREEQYWREYIE